MAEPRESHWAREDRLRAQEARAELNARDAQDEFLRSSRSRDAQRRLDDAEQAAYLTGWSARKERKDAERDERRGKGIAHWLLGR